MTVHFNQLPSRVAALPPEKALRPTVSRVDPFHDERLLRLGAGVDWWSRRHAARAIENDALTGVATKFKVRPSDCRARVEKDLRKAQQLIGALAQWRTMSSEQVEAMTGLSGVELGVKRPWAITLWGADLIDYAEAGGSFHVGTQRSSAQRLLRLSHRDASTLAWLEHLSSFTEFVALNGGDQLRQERQSPRHNVLAVELGLRVAEFAPTLELVLGESVSSYASLLEIETRKHADMTLVRRDGLRVAVEVTASDGRLREKVREVAALLRRSSRRDTIVLFFTASNRVAHRKMLKAITTEAPDLGDRIAVADASDWFPATHHAAADFPALPVAFYRGGSWVREALDSVPLVTTDPHITEVFKNARGLFGVPHWLAEGERFDFNAWLLERALPSGLPVPEGAQTGVAKPLPRLVY